MKKLVLSLVLLSYCSYLIAQSCEAIESSLKTIKSRTIHGNYLHILKELTDLKTICPNKTAEIDAEIQLIFKQFDVNYKQITAKHLAAQAKLAIIEQNDYVLGLRLAEAAIQTTEAPLPEAQAALHSVVSNTNFYSDTIQVVYNQSFAHQMPIFKAILSNNGQILATCGKDSLVKLWDTKTGKLLNILRGSKNSYRFAVFAPDDKCLLTASDYEADLWDITTGVLLDTFKQHWKPIDFIAFCPDNKRIVLTNLFGDDYYWDIKTKEKTHYCNCVGEWTDFVAISSDGKYALTENPFVGIVYRDMLDNGKTYTLHPKTKGIRLGTFSNDGQYVLFKTYNDTIQIWDLKQQTLITNNKYTIKPTALAFSSDNKYILIGNIDGTALLIEAKTGIKIRTLLGHKSPITSVAFTPNNQFIITADDDGTIKIWAIHFEPFVKTIASIESPISSAVLLPDSLSLLISNSDSSALLMDIETGRINQTFKLHEDYINAAFYSNKEYMVVTGASDNILRYFNTKTGKLIKAYRVTTDDIYPLILMHDGKNELINEDNYIFICDFNTGRKLDSIQTGNISSFSLSLDEKYFLTSEKGYLIKLWSIKTGKIVKEFVGHPYSIYSVAFSKDGKRILAEDSNNKSVLWDIETGQILGAFNDYYKNMNARGLNLTTYEKYHLLRTYNGYPKLLDLETGQLIQTFIGSTRADEINYGLSNAFFFKNTQYVLTVGKDNKVRRWRTIMDILSDKQIPQLTGTQKKLYGIK